MNASRCWKPIALLALFLGAPWSHAGQPTCSTDKSSPARTKHNLTRKSYPVADLVRTLDQGPAGAGGPDLLVRAIVRAVMPPSWDKRGGPGTIEYIPATKTLVIKQTAGAHARVAAVLKALSMIQPKQQAPGTITQAVYSPSPAPSGQLKQYGHFVLDNVRLNAMGVSCTIKRVRIMYKGDGIEADVAKCAMTGGESEKKADVPKVLTDLLEKVGKGDKGEATAAPVSPGTTCPSACNVLPTLPQGPTSSEVTVKSGLTAPR